MSEAEALAAAFPRRRTARSATHEMTSAPKLRCFSPSSACPTKFAAEEAPLLRRNSSYQCPWQSTQNPADAATTEKIADGRQQKRDRESIAVAVRTPMPQAAAPFVQRFAVQRRAPKATVRCNGLLCRALSGTDWQLDYLSRSPNV